jgi:hypothetical protein
LAETLASRAPRADEVLPASSVYYKYLRGEAGPSRELVDSLDNVLPGTSVWYDHPVWRLAGQPVDVFELGELLKRLPEDIREGWVAQSSGASQMFWRRRGMDLTLKAAKLLEGNGLDETAGALGLIQDALLRQDQVGYLHGWIVWGLVAERVRSDPVCTVLYPNFFGALARTLRTVVFESASVRRYLDVILESAREEATSSARQEGRGVQMRRLRKALASKNIVPISMFDLVLLEELTLSPFALSLVSSGKKAQ